MKKLSMILFFILANKFCLAGITINELYDYCTQKSSQGDAICMAYITGILDTLMVPYSGKANEDYIDCASTLKINPQQVSEEFINSMKTMPRYMNGDAGLIIYSLIWSDIDSKCLKYRNFKVQGI